MAVQLNLSMDDLVAFDAILLPAEGTPRIFPLMTSSYQTTDPTTGMRRTTRVPHPELHMHLGGERWVAQEITTLYGMNRNLPTPFMVFYNPRTGPRGGVVNQCIKEIQGRHFRPDQAWRGDIVVAKYRDIRAGDILHCSAADFPLIKNYFALNFPTTQN